MSRSLAPGHGQWGVQRRRRPDGAGLPCLTRPRPGAWPGPGSGTWLHGTSGAALGNDDEVLGVVREHLAAVLGHHDEVLDPHAEAAREVDPRLDGDDVARHERVARLRSERRRLVYLEADAVPEPVAVRLAVARSADRRARHLVDVPAGLARPHRLERAPLRVAHELVDARRLVVELTGGERAGAVGAVPVGDAAPVHHHELV